MGNIIDYVLENGNKTFKEAPLCNEDALVLCQFIYLKFDELLEQLDEKTVSITELDHNPKKDMMFSDPRYEKDNRALFEAMTVSKRFADVKLCMYINRIEIENETQFAAATFLCEDDTKIVVFRGTDENMVGWQEDFGLALKRPIVGQMLSVMYLKDVADMLNGDFMVAGHSKGGNLAVYSAMCVEKAVRKRISRIYSFDGPGFRPDFLEEKNYGKIEDRVVKVIPRSSLVGMLLDDGEDSLVVEARNIGMKQHNPYMWVIKDGHFEKSELSEQHKLLLKSLNEWILSLNELGLERFVLLLNDILDSTEADTTVEFSENVLKHAVPAIKTAKDVDDETKEFFFGFVRSYLEMASEMVTEEAKSKMEETVSEVKERLNEMLEETKTFAKEDFFEAAKREAVGVKTFLETVFKEAKNVVEKKG